MVGAGAARVRPEALLEGTVAVAAPHADDELIGCGATLAAIAGRAEVHVVYVTDGEGAPSPPLPWLRVDRSELAAVRRDEARQALAVLGLSPSRAHFLSLPDGRLRRNPEVLEERLSRALEQIRPDHILVPFRFDRHPDHLAVNRAVRSLLVSARRPGRLLEYFVYARWRLLPEGDVRAYIAPRRLIEVETRAVTRTLKRRALEACRSQTTCFYPWQTRPNLTAEFLDTTCAGSEWFLDPGRPEEDAAIFERWERWIRLAHVLEPRLKQGKDRLAGIVRRS